MPDKPSPWRERWRLLKWYLWKRHRYYWRSYLSIRIGRVVIGCYFDDD